MLRLTNTDKWRDTFFYNLTPAPKLVFIFLYENCNEAGFMDLNYEQMQELMKLDKKKIADCLGVLDSKYLTNKDGSKIWLRNFLLHQNKLPLDIKSEDGKRIHTLLERHYENFNAPIEIKAIMQTANQKQTQKREPKIFTKPTLDDVVAKFPEEEKAKVEEIWLYYESCGWKVGNKPMIDWVSAFRGCFMREKKKAGTYQKPEKQTRLDKIVEANDKIKEIDFNTLKPNQNE